MVTYRMETTLNAASTKQPLGAVLGDELQGADAAITIHKRYDEPSVHRLPDAMDSDLFGYKIMVCGESRTVAPEDVQGKLSRIPLDILDCFILF